MKAIVIAFILLTGNNIVAQHCPFDGTHLVAIKVIDEKGNMVTNNETVFYLLEVDNIMADSCTSYPGIIKKQLLNNNAFINKIDTVFKTNSYSEGLKTRLTKEGIFANANRMVTINQAENTCTLIGKSETVYTNYIYQQRKFVIVYWQNNKEIRQPVPVDFIYHLCEGSKDIEKFKPVVIKLSVY
jgi:hypothetical protein